MRIWKGKAKPYDFGEYRPSIHIGCFRLSSLYLSYEEEVKLTRYNENTWHSGARYRSVNLEFRPWRWKFGKVEFWHDGSHRMFHAGPIFICLGD